jgi:TolB-like protein
MPTGRQNSIAASLSPAAPSPASNVQRHVGYSHPAETLGHFRAPPHALPAIFSSGSMIPDIGSRDLLAGEIFISYRRADAAWARLLHDKLKAEGVEAWYDGLVGPGQEWRTATAEALEASQIFVLLFSDNAAQSSDIVKELSAATHEKKLIVPVRLQNIEPKGAFLYELASRNWVNAYEDTEARLAELAKSLAHLVRTGARDESVLPYERSPEPARKRGYLPALIVAAAIIIALGAAGIFWMHAGRKTSQPASVAPRIAVRLFHPLGDDPEVRQFAGGLQAEIVGELSDNQVPVDSIQDGPKTQGAAKAPAAYAFDGTVERRGTEFLVHAHLEDARQAVTVWSSDFSGDAGAPEVLQKEISALASIVGKAAVDFDATAKGDTDAMALYIKSNLYTPSARGQMGRLEEAGGEIPPVGIFAICLRNYQCSPGGGSIAFPGGGIARNRQDRRATCIDARSARCGRLFCPVVHLSLHRPLGRAGEFSSAGPEGCATRPGVDQHRKQSFARSGAQQGRRRLWPPDAGAATQKCEPGCNPDPGLCCYRQQLRRRHAGAKRRQVLAAGGGGMECAPAAGDFQQSLGCSIGAVDAGWLCANSRSGCGCAAQRAGGAKVGGSLGQARGRPRPDRSA